MSEDPSIPLEAFESLMNMAKMMRVYYEALLAENFTPVQALQIIVAMQQSTTAAAQTP